MEAAGASETLASLYQKHCVISQKRGTLISENDSAKDVQIINNKI
jgi:hypothetical protein